MTAKRVNAFARIPDGSSNDAQEERSDSNLPAEDGGDTNREVKTQEGDRLSTQRASQPDTGNATSRGRRRRSSHSDEGPQSKNYGPHGAGSSNGATASSGSQGPRSPPTPPRSTLNQQELAGIEDSHIPPAGVFWHGYEPQLVNQARRAQQIDVSDAQLVEALQQHDAYSHEASQRSALPAQADQLSVASTIALDRSQSTAQPSPKRKRVFSNRTKTGCLTCRRRKKKCDEQHPVCEFV